MAGIAGRPVRKSDPTVTEGIEFAEFAEDADLTEPGAAHRTTGWVVEKPSYKEFNYLHNRTRGWIKRLNAAGYFIESHTIDVTIGGAVDVGDIRRITVDGNSVTYETGLGDAANNDIAAHFAAALNTDAVVGALVFAEAGGAVIRVTYRRPGVDMVLTVAMTVDVGGVSTISAANVVAAPYAIRQADDDPNDADFVHGSSALDDTGDPAQDARVTFRKAKWAVRAGKVAGAQWDDGNTGEGSAAFGEGCTASGAGSFAHGNGALASGARAFAHGNGAAATGNDSTAIGPTAIAAGANAVALGSMAGATTDACALGLNAQATAAGSSALGTGAAAAGIGSTAIGSAATTAGGTNALAAQGGTASAANAVAIGPAAIASGTSALAVNGGTASQANAVAIGSGANASGAGAVALRGTASGAGAFATTGGTATSMRSVALANGQSTAIDSFASGDHCEATADGAVAIGNGASAAAAPKATAVGAVATGAPRVASSVHAIEASGQGSRAHGEAVKAEADFSQAKGFGARALVRGEVCRAAGAFDDIDGFAERGRAQYGTLHFFGYVDGAATRALDPQNTAGVLWTPPTERAIHCRLQAVARHSTGAPADLDKFASWEIRFVLHKTNGGVLTINGIVAITGAAFAAGAAGVNLPIYFDGTGGGGGQYGLQVAVAAGALTVTAVGTVGGERVRFSGSLHYDLVGGEVR